MAVKFGFSQWNNQNGQFSLFVNALIIISGLFLGPCIAACPWISADIKTYLLVVLGAFGSTLKGFDKLLGFQQVDTSNDSLTNKTGDK